MSGSVYFYLNRLGKPSILYVGANTMRGLLESMESVRLADICIIRPHSSTSWMRPIAAEQVAWSAGRSVCHDRELSDAKMAEPIEMSFGIWTLVGPKNHVVDGSPEGAVLREKVAGRHHWIA